MLSFFLPSLVPLYLSFGVPTWVLGGLGGVSFVFPLAQGGLHQERPPASMFSLSLSLFFFFSPLSRSYSFRSAWVGPPFVFLFSHASACFLKPVANKCMPWGELPAEPSMKSSEVDRVSKFIYLEASVLRICCDLKRVTNPQSCDSSLRFGPLFSSAILGEILAIWDLRCEITSVFAIWSTKFCICSAGEHPPHFPSLQTLLWQTPIMRIWCQCAHK